MSIKLENNNLIIDGSHSEKRSAEYYGVLLHIDNSKVLIPVFLLSSMIGTQYIKIQSNTYGGKNNRIDYKIQISIDKLYDILHENKWIDKEIILYEVRYTNSRIGGPHATMYKILKTSNNFVIKELGSQYAIQQLSNIEPWFSPSNTYFYNTYERLLSGLYKEYQNTLTKYALLINYINNIIRVLSIKLFWPRGKDLRYIVNNINRNSRLKEYVLMKSISMYSNRTSVPIDDLLKRMQRKIKGILKAVQEQIYEIYILILIPYAHNVCTNGRQVLTTMNCVSTSCTWIIKSSQNYPTAIVETPSGNKYTMWYQFPYPNPKKNKLRPDIVIFKGVYIDYEELQRASSIDKIIIIDAKTKYTARDHNRMKEYINNLRQRYNPRELIVILPFIDRFDKSGKNPNPYSLKEDIDINNIHLYVIENVYPNENGELEFMKIMYGLLS